MDLNDIMPPDWQTWHYTLVCFDQRLIAAYGEVKRTFPDAYVNVKDGLRVNSWCGLRSPACTIGAANSAHKSGKALDFHCGDLAGLRRHLCAKSKEWGYGRLENAADTPTWAHFDVLRKEGWDYAKNGIYVFKP